MAINFVIYLRSVFEVCTDADKNFLCGKGKVGLYWPQMRFYVAKDMDKQKLPQHFLSFANWTVHFSYWAAHTRSILMLNEFVLNKEIFLVEVQHLTIRMCNLLWIIMYLSPMRLSSVSLFTHRNSKDACLSSHVLGNACRLLQMWTKRDSFRNTTHC